MRKLVYLSFLESRHLPTSRLNDEKDEAKAPSPVITSNSLRLGWERAPQVAILLPIECGDVRWETLLLDASCNHHLAGLLRITDVLPWMRCEP